MMWVIMRGATTRLLSFNGMIDFGCSNRLNSRTEFLTKTKCLISLIPPDVDPALAPTNNNMKNSMKTYKKKEDKDKDKGNDEEEEDDEEEE